MSDIYSFKLESDQLIALEKIREDGRDEIQTYKEEMLKKKEKEYRDHEGLLSRYNAQLHELESKLMFTTAVEEEVRQREAKKEEEKKCAVM